MDMLMQTVGIVGAALLLLAYFYNNTKRWSSATPAYHLTNLFGAILICINTYYFNVYGPFILNFFWALIAFNGIRFYYRSTSQ
jgi:hypothetical protein